MHRWLLAVAVSLASCGESSSTGAVSIADSALFAMLDVRTEGCGPNVGFGTATLVDDTLALTAAHVVAGADVVAVVDLDGVEHDARVVLFDPDQDVAALRVPTGLAAPVTLQPTGTDDIGDGVIAVSRGAFDDRVVATLDVDVPRHVGVATTDIYLERDVLRPGFEVSGDIEPGDSGTMVVGADGAAGILWSRSTTSAGRAWAVDVPADLRRSSFRESLDGDVDTGRCIR